MWTTQMEPNWEWENGIGCDDWWLIYLYFRCSFSGRKGPAILRYGLSRCNLFLFNSNGGRDRITRRLKYYTRESASSLRRCATEWHNKNVRQNSLSMHSRSSRKRQVAAKCQFVRKISFEWGNIASHFSATVTLIPLAVRCVEAGCWAGSNNEYIIDGMMSWCACGYCYTISIVLC